MAIGDFEGSLIMYDVEKGSETYKVKAHEGIINSIDAVGGLGIGYGPTEIVTGGRDGTGYLPELILSSRFEVIRLCETLGHPSRRTCSLLGAS